MQRLLDLIKAAISAVLAKLKGLAIHIIKHPLGSLWWLFKMYFALMFFSLFVACSLGSFSAHATEGFCASGEVIPNVGCGVPAPSGKLWHSTTGYLSTNKTFSHKELAEAQKAACGWFLGVSASGTSAGMRECTGGRSIRYKNCNWVTLPNGTGGHCDYNGSWQYSTLNGTDYQDSNLQYYCPPEGPAWAEFLTLYGTGTNSKCTKPFDDTNNCFKESKYLIGPQFHYSQADAGAGNVCVEADNGEKCPWKESAGGHGVFEPDRDNQAACKLPTSIPDPTPKDPDQCFPTGSGFKACKADPNDKCTVNSTNALSCGNSCGYMNGEFMCFTQRDPTVDPNKPDPTPRPDKDDTITDPQKALSDMVKGDFKQIQRGVETRLDGFTADMANLMKSQEYAATQANKNSAQGNKLLNSINQNTANTVEELKKLSDAGAAVEGITKPEFEDKNDWSARNFGTVLKEKADQLMQIPVMKSISGFFTVGFSGTCPTYNVTVWVFEININQFCSPEVQALFPYIRAVVLLMCSFFAIRVALL
jgi:hypothetical protein